MIRRYLHRSMQSTRIFSRDGAAIRVRSGDTIDVDLSDVPEEFRDRFVEVEEPTTRTKPIKSEAPENWE
mgnify:CR=1 FL=1